MAGFDMDAYLARRNELDAIRRNRISKQEEVARAAEEKKNALLSAIETSTQNVAAVSQDDWVNKLDLDPTGVAGTIVNNVASAVSGASRAVSNTLTLANDADTALNRRLVSDQDREAYNRYLQGQATEEDLTRLNTRKGIWGESTNPSTWTTFQRIQHTNDNIANSKKVTDAFNLESIVNQTRRNELNQDLKNHYAADFGSLPENASLGDQALGLGKLALHGLGDAITNPGATIEYMSENAPQLLTGLLGKAGRVAMGASNLGYGTDLYRQGAQNRQKEANGQLPSLGQDMTDALWGLGAAGMEQLGDKLELRNMKTAAGKVLGTAAKEGEEAAQPIARAGFKESLKNTGKAGVQGLHSEALTEGVQTYMEGEATGKPASGSDIYAGAVIGGASGAGLSSAGRAVAESLGATPEKIAKQAADIQDAKAFEKATETNNVSAYLDPKNKKQYNPVFAAQALHAHTQLDTATPETKAENAKQIDAIVGKLTEDRLGHYEQTPAGLAEMQADLTRLSADPKADPEVVDFLKEGIAAYEKLKPEEIKKAQAKVKEIDDQLASIRPLREELNQRLTEKTDVDSLVKTANVPAEKADESSQAAAEKVLTLSMAAPHKVSAQAAKTLAENAGNGLSALQRDYFRAFAASRDMEEKLKTKGTVHKEVLEGNAKTGQLGIQQYRAMMDEALSTGNKKAADRALRMLGSFKASHANKVAQFSSWYAEAVRDNKKIPIRREKGQGYVVAKPGQKSFQEINPKSANLIALIRSESVLLNQTQAALKAAYDLKFSPQSHPVRGGAPVVNSQSTQSTQSTAVNSVDSQATPVAPMKKAENHSTVDSTVNTVEGSTQPAVQESKEAPESASDPVVEVKERKVSDPAKRKDLVGAIMRLTGNRGIHSSLVEDLTGDTLKHAGRAKALFTEQGQEDLSDLVEELKGEGFQVNSAEEVAALIREQVKDPVFPDHIKEERAAKAAHQQEVAEANALAAEHGVKGVRGKRTRAHIEADIARLEAERARMEAEEEALAIQVESLVSEALAQGKSETEIHALLQSLGLEETHEETHAESGSENQSTTGQAPEAAAQSTQSRDSERSGDGQTEEGTDGTEGSGQVIPEGTLDVLRVTPSPAGTLLKAASKAGTLFADYFTQVEKREGDTTPRPLVAVKDFLARLLKKEVSLYQFLDMKEGSASEEQRRAVQSFIQQAKQWNPLIQSNLKQWDAKGKTEYLYRDLMQFLITANPDGSLDLPQNVKTAMAYAGFSWLTESASRSRVNGPEEINALLNREEGAEVSEQEWEKLQYVATRRNTTVNALGRRAVQALGFKAKANAPLNMLPNLEAALGEHILLMLESAQLVQAVEFQDQELNPESTSQAKQQFVALAREVEGEPTLSQALLKLVAANRGSQNIIDHIFSVEPGLVEPSLKPIPFKQKVTGTGQAVPTELQELLEKDNAEPNYIRQDLWDVFSALDPAIQLQIAGADPFIEGQTHVARKKGIEARNDALQREIDRIHDFVNVTLTQSPEWLDSPFYFDHDVWNQQRVGIKNNAVNPQMSKVHRHLIYRKAWETVVDFDNPEQMANYRLRVLEGLGVNTGKETNEKTLARYEGMFNPEAPGLTEEARKEAAIRNAAVEVLVQRLQGVGMTPAMQEKLLAGVQVGGEAMHSLDALMAVAQERFARDLNQTSFTTRLMGEIDGVSNGPILAHLLFGAAESPDALKAFLNKGGFYFEGDAQVSYNHWRAAPGSRDLYESMTERAFEFLTQHQQENPKLGFVYQAVQEFIGELVTPKGDVTSAGRNLSKDAVRPLVFGSSLSRAVESMAEAYVENIYKKLEKAAGQTRAEQVHLLKTLNILLYEAEKVSLTLDGKDLTNLVFTEAQKTAIKGTFTRTFGSAFKEAIKTKATNPQTNQTDLSVFLERRDEITRASDLIYRLYDASYQSLKEAYVAELVAAGKMDLDKNGNPAHDLTQAQQRELDTRLETLHPVMHTALSKASQQAEAGLPVFNTTTQLSQNRLYHGEVHTAQGNFTPHAYERVHESPGVRMVSMPIHGFDSAVSHRAGADGHSLNLHDARGMGVGIFTGVGQALNSALWNASLEYSPMGELYSTLEHSLAELVSLMQRREVPKDLKDRLAQALVDFGNKHGIDPRASIDRVVTDLKHAATIADENKFQVLAQAISVDQYSSEGAHYVVTPKDRAKAAELAAKVDKKIDPKTWNNALFVKNMLESRINAIAPKEEAPAHPKSAKELMALLQSQGEVNAKEFLRHLYQILKAQAPSPTRNFNVTLLQQLGKLAKDDLKITLAKAGERSDYAWFETGKGIFVNPDIPVNVLTEALLHETTHAVTSQAIESDSTPAVKEAVGELNTLLGKAREYVKGAKLTDWITLLEGPNALHELVAYGMTSPRFQQEVLEKITLQSTTRKNSLVTGMKAFIGSLVRILFPDADQRRQEVAVNGMTVLIQNVSALFAANPAQGNTTQGTIYSMAASPQTYTTLDIFKALGNGKTNPFFADHLQGLLSSIVERLHGPFGSLMAARMANQTQTATQVWNQAKQEGAAPFAFEAMNAGFTLSDQEAFVAEQVDATIRAALDGNTSQTTAAYNELSKLYQEVYQGLAKDGSDFYVGDWSQASPQEQQEAKALYDFIFKLEKNQGDRSDYLARFATMGLTHPGFNQILQAATGKLETQADTSFFGRLQGWFQNVMRWVAGKLTHTYDGQPGDEKLTALVDQLVKIETRRRDLLTQEPTQWLEPLERAVENTTKQVKERIEAWGGSDFFRNSDNGFVKATGALLRTAAGNRADLFMEKLQEFQERALKDKEGIGLGILREAQGANSTNRVFHMLLRTTKKLEGDRKDIMTQTGKVVLESFEKNGEYLTPEMKASLAAMLRIDLASLYGPYTLDQIQMMVNTPSAVEKAIRVQLDQLKGFDSRYQDFFVTQAKALAYYKATGKVRIPFLLLNARNISRMEGTPFMGKLTDAQSKQAEAAIDLLTSLYGLQYVGNKHLAQVKAVISQEMARTDEGNGIELMLKLHQNLQKESKERLFEGSEGLMMKGYLPETYNPHREIVVATVADGLDLLKQGYKKGALVTVDPLDPDKTPRHLYYLEYGAKQDYLSGAMSMTGMRSKGSRAASDNITDIEDWKANRDDLRTMHKQKMQIGQLFPSRKTFDPTQVKANFAVPVMNPKGQVVDYRYLMRESTKDTLLERDNRFDQLLGKMAGNIFDKVTAKEQNRKIVQALKDQHKQDFSTRASGYVHIGENSDNPEYREQYEMLPENTKQAIREIWGEDGLWIRHDLKDMVFGYRKPSLSNLLKRDYEVSGLADKFFIQLATALFKDQAQVKVARAEAGWQEVVKEAKDILVIRSFTVLKNNVVSNISLLLLAGVPVKDIFHHHRIALKGAMDYRRDSEALARIRTQLQANYIVGSKSDMEREIRRLEDALARNPVHQLVEEGLMPTIVEDVSSEDPYSYKTHLKKKAEKYTSRLNPKVKAAGEFVYMARDTKMYQALYYGTQISDFVARYTLYQHLVNKKDAPLSHADAVQKASDAFVNYDIPSHRKIQWANDMGLVMFTKYYIRIQKVIMELYRERPGRALAMMLLDHYFDQLPLLADSSVITHPHNPLSTGAFKFLEVLDDLATVKIGGALLH